jgi:hypothetical protein
MDPLDSLAGNTLMGILTRLIEKSLPRVASALPVPSYLADCANVVTQPSCGRRATPAGFNPSGPLSSQAFGAVFGSSRRPSMARRVAERPHPNVESIVHVGCVWSRMFDRGSG